MADNNVLNDIQSAPVPPQAMPTTEVKASEKAGLGDKGEKGSLSGEDIVTVTGAADLAHGPGVGSTSEWDDESLTPTEEQLMTLRKVAAPMP